MIYRHKKNPPLWKMMFLIAHNLLLMKCWEWVSRVKAFGGLTRLDTRQIGPRIGQISEQPLAPFAQ